MSHDGSMSGGGPLQGSAAEWLASSGLGPGPAVSASSPHEPHSKAEAVCYFDDSQHEAPPVLLEWINRKGHRTDPRWLFVRCCGAVETPRAWDGVDVIHTRHKCSDTKLPCSARCHRGQITLTNTSKRQVGNRVKGAWMVRCDGLLSGFGSRE
jgi:hypothetical protein